MKKPAGGSPSIMDDSRCHRQPADSAALFGEWSVIEVADAAKALWGDLAVTAIAWGALAANCESDMQEYCFWFQAFDCLQAALQKPSLNS
ncbi:MAG: hypothetical protein E5W38_03225 [Mesorhizobium sp.]|nr:MAG: hypothetical protein E5W38_03225 [Mesorhizobium sp.]